MSEQEKTAEIFSKMKALLEKTSAFVKSKIPGMKVFLGNVIVWLKLKMPIVKEGAVKAVGLAARGIVLLRERFLKSKKDQ